MIGTISATPTGFPLPPEIRTRDAEGKVIIEKAAPTLPARAEATKAPRRGRVNGPAPEEPTQRPEPTPFASAPPTTGMNLRMIRVYPYGVARNRLQQAAKRLGVPAMIVRAPDEADALVTLRAYYRDRQQPIVDAESRGMPIYVLRANTINQVEQFLGDLFNLHTDSVPVNGEMDLVREQTQQAISAVLNGERWVDLPPGPSLVRRLQHEMARGAELVSHSYGKEPRRHVRIFRE